MNIVLLGAPGSGKGTQGENLVLEYGLKKLSTGDLFREEIARKSELGVQLKEIVEAGKLVSDDIVSQLVISRLTPDYCQNGVIFDGFPRTVSQAKALDEYMDSVGNKIDIVLELVVKEEDLIERLSNRYSCKKCNAGYNKLLKNPKVEGVCDVCGGTEFFVREDDRPEVIKKRFRVYQEQTELLLPYYEKKGLLFSVEANDNMDTVAKNIKLIIKQAIVY